MEIRRDSPWVPDAVLPRIASKALMNFMDEYLNFTNENSDEHDRGADEYGDSNESTLQLLQKAVDVKPLLFFLSLISVPQQRNRHGDLLFQRIESLSGNVWVELQCSAVWRPSSTTEIAPNCCQITKGEPKLSLKVSPLTFEPSN
jgi:hypothetical protein